MKTSEMFRRVSDRWYLLTTSKKKQDIGRVKEIEAQRERNRKLNLKVKTRQVLRRYTLARAMERVNRDFGGEPRKSRRRIALRWARREWRPEA